MNSVQKQQNTQSRLRITVRLGFSRDERNSIEALTQRLNDYAVDVEGFDRKSIQILV